MNPIAVNTLRTRPGGNDRIFQGSILAAPDLTRFTGLDRLFDVLLDGLSLNRDASARGPQGDVLRPVLDVVKEGNRYLVSVELPGVEAKDLSVDVRDEELTISGEKRRENEMTDKTPEGGTSYYGERYYGRFQRVLALPEDVDGSAITADHKNGVLTITLPRREPAQSKSRSITVNS
ncbi:MAG: Hsp20/alpha crystallin family protein [Desulfovibrio sp.]|jgi:HSP20 family protein|nr:Hsp20/alpha crystallin family protein [Desulfovibrio sp.]